MTEDDSLYTYINYRGKQIKLPKDYEQYALPYENIADIIPKALKTIEEEKSGKQLGLFTRFDNINRSFAKYMRFSNVYVFGGLSGSGKSYILSNILEDLTNFESLNSNFVDKEDVMALHFGYEMASEDEIIRTTARKMEKSYSYVLSSEYDKNKQEYNKISNKEFEEIRIAMESLVNHPIIYCGKPGTISQMYYTIAQFADKFPNKRFIISNDHTLLNLKGKNIKNQIDLIVDAAQKFIKIRQDFEAMIIALSQLNGDIEDAKRKLNPALHYPIRTDIHGSNELYNAADNVVIFHRPELIDLRTYGEDELNTEDMIHGAVLKARKGKAGNIWFKNRLDIGTLEEATKEDFTNTFGLS